MTVEFRDRPEPKTALPPASPRKTRNVGKCAYCRGKHSHPPQNCSNQPCQRRFHLSCNRSAPPSLCSECSECAKVCAKCWKPASSPVVCSYCQLSFHPACSPVLDSLDQLCCLCIREQLRSGIEHCVSTETKEGRNYHVVKFACVSWIHRCRIQAAKCTAKNHEMGYFERAAFQPWDRTKTIYGCLQIEGCMEGDGKLYWEPLETIAAYNEQFAREKPPNPGPAIQPAQPVIFPAPQLVQQARDMLLTCGYCPAHPERLQACMQFHELLDDSEGSVLRLCKEIFTAVLQGKNSLECHQVQVDVSVI